MKPSVMVGIISGEYPMCCHLKETIWLLPSFMADNTKSRVQKAQKHLPPPAVPVHVQCDGFRCLAYCDKNGAWVNYQDGKPLSGIVRVIEYNLD
jgi:hypothetical protein